MEKDNLENLGEFGLIDRIKNNLPALVHSETLVGIGDDAAVIDTGNNLQLISTDMLLEGVHFDLTYYPLKHLGYKSIVTGVSDIVAMNGLPTQAFISLGLSNRFGLEAIDELYEGIKLACEDFNIDLAGGDTNPSRSGLIISVTVNGKVPKNQVTFRSGAQNNDIVCVSGDLGGAYMGLQILEREKQEYLANPAMQPMFDDKSYVVGRQLKPEGRTDIIHELKEKGVVPTSMIDITDGLASDVLQLSKSSGKGFTIFFENIPIENQTLEVCSEFNLNPISTVINGGEDYELLMTIAQADFEKIKSITDITPIGFVTDEQQNWLVLNSGEKTKLIAPGFKNGV